MQLINLDAAIAALQSESQSNNPYISGLAMRMADRLRALPTVQPDPLGASQVGWLICEKPGATWKYTDYDPERMPNVRGWVSKPVYFLSPTDDDLDRAALARPKVRALVDAIDRFAESEPPYGPDCWEAVKAAIADLKGGA
jgi:hypothetical protein